MPPSTFAAYSLTATVMSRRTVWSGMRSASPLFRACCAIAQIPSAASIASEYRSVRGLVDTEKHLAIANNGLNGIKCQRVRSCVASRTDVKLGTMPGTDDVTYVFIVTPTVYRTIGANTLDHSSEYPTLAHRSALMRTHIAPCIKGAVESKDADLNPVDDH